MDTKAIKIKAYIMSLITALIAGDICIKEATEKVIRSVMGYDTSPLYSVLARHL